MHKNNLASAILFFIVSLLVFSCTKTNSEPPPVNITPQPVTYIFSFGDENNLPDTLQFANDSSKIIYVGKKSAGNLRIEFAGKNGSGILGEPKVLYSGRMNWHMKDGDTIRVFDNNQLTHLMVTKKSNSPLYSGISMQTGRQELLSDAEQRINNYFKNTIKTEKFFSW